MKGIIEIELDEDELYNIANDTIGSIGDCLSIKDVIKFLKAIKKKYKKHDVYVIDSQVLLNLAYEREETYKEYEERLKGEKQKADEQEQYERETYEILKKKFGDN